MHIQVWAREKHWVSFSISLHTISLSRLQSLTECRAGLAVSKPQWSSWLYPCRAKLQMCIWLSLYFTWVPRIQTQILMLSWQDPEPSPQPPLCPLIPGYHELRNLQCYRLLPPWYCTQCRHSARGWICWNHEQNESFLISVCLISWSKLFVLYSTISSLFSFPFSFSCVTQEQAGRWSRSWLHCVLLARPNSKEGSSGSSHLPEIRVHSPRQHHLSLAGM